MDSIQFGKKCRAYNKKYKELFGYVPCPADYSCSQDEYFEALVKAVFEKRELTAFITRREPQPADPNKRY